MELSIEATLAKARAERRAARFQLTVVPVTVGTMGFFIGVSIGFGAGVPFVSWISAVSIVLIYYAILPTDRVTIEWFYRALVVVYTIFGIGFIIRSITLIAKATSGEPCYADELVATLDEEQRIHCGWVLEFGVRNCITGIVNTMFLIWILRGRLTIESYGSFLDVMIFGKDAGASAF